MDLHNGITEGATGGILITSIFETCTRWHQKHKMNKKNAKYETKQFYILGKQKKLWKLFWYFWNSHKTNQTLQKKANFGKINNFTYLTKKTNKKTEKHEGKTNDIFFRTRKNARTNKRSKRTYIFTNISKKPGNRKRIELIIFWL